MGGQSNPEELFLRALELNREAPDLAVRPLANRICELFPTCMGRVEDEIDRICRAFMDPIFACAKVNDAAADVLDELRALGIRTGIVSNTPWGSPAALWREELIRHSLLHRVDVVVFCVDVGWRKPHPAPFLAALQQLHATAQDAFFVGDDPRWDVEGARRAGLRPLLLSVDAEHRADCTVIRNLREVVGYAAGDTDAS